MCRSCSFQVKQNRIRHHSVVRAAQVRLPYVEQARGVTFLPHPVHERGGRVGPVDDQAALFQVLRLEAGTGPNLEDRAMA